MYPGNGIFFLRYKVFMSSKRLDDVIYLAECSCIGVVQAFCKCYHYHGSILTKKVASISHIEVLVVGIVCYHSGRVCADSELYYTVNSGADHSKVCDEHERLHTDVSDAVGHRAAQKHGDEWQVNAILQQY